MGDVGRGAVGGCVMLGRAGLADAEAGWSGVGVACRVGWGEVQLDGVRWGGMQVDRVG